jgi:hypothetical protein
MLSSCVEPKLARSLSTTSRFRELVGQHGASGRSSVSLSPSRERREPAENACRDGRRSAVTPCVPGGALPSSSAGANARLRPDAPREHGQRLVAVGQREARHRMRVGPGPWVSPSRRRRPCAAKRDSAGAARARLWRAARSRRRAAPRPSAISAPSVSRRSRRCAHAGPALDADGQVNVTGIAPFKLVS